jgi:hypothetical protein
MGEKKQGGERGGGGSVNIFGCETIHIRINMSVYAIDV